MSAARLALTVGDPAGIGPEIVLKALAAERCPPAEWVVYGPAAALEERARRFGLPSPTALAAAVVDVACGTVPLGEVSAEGGRAAAAAVQAAAADAVAGRVRGLVTAPLNKESLRAAGHPWPGHTELLAFGRAVNVTLGLPFVRTSVDHGTAFDIAASGTADAGSLLEAMSLATVLAREGP